MQTRLGSAGLQVSRKGATKLEHLDDGVTALDVELTEEDVAELKAPYVTRPVLGHS